MMKNIVIVINTIWKDILSAFCIFEIGQLDEVIAIQS